jgi:DNA primase catalytic subunit
MGRANLADIAVLYYSRKDVQKAIQGFCKDREAVARYLENFSKRPSTIEYPDEILQEAKNGATSFHCSEEIWENPLELSTDLDRKELDKIRKGWDLLIDIDSKYLEYSKIMARLIIDALEFHGVRSYGIKFSGSKGFHIIVPWKAFPEEVNGIETRMMFPEFPRAIASYLHKFTEKELINKISRLTTDKSYIKDESEAKKVIPDIVLVSSRHLFRTPYSLHDKTGFASVVINKKDIMEFEPRDADYLKVKIRDFYPDAKKEEAKELLIQALDYQQHKSKEEKKEYKEFEKIDVDKSSINYPPCIKKILDGLEDGRKRALFILINYFRSLNFSKEETKKKIDEWNEKNKKPLKDNYVIPQIEYSFSRKQVLPPNCDKMYYKDIDVCHPDNFCNKIKNPVNYTVLKGKIAKRK